MSWKGLYHPTKPERESEANPGGLLLLNVTSISSPNVLVGLLLQVVCGGAVQTGAYWRAPARCRLARSSHCACAPGAVNILIIERREFACGSSDSVRYFDHE